MGHPLGKLSAFAVTYLILCLAIAAQAQTIVDRFTDGSNWGTPMANGADISFSNGRANYTFFPGTNAHGSAAIPRNTPFLSSTQDWSIQVDVHLDSFALTTNNQYCELDLGVSKSGSYNTFVLLKLARSFYQQGFYVEDAVRINGADAKSFAVGHFNVTAQESALRMDYSAANHTISFYFAANGGNDGYNWTLEGIMDVASGSYDLGLNPTDTFEIFLLGSSTSQPITIGQAYFSNLQITSNPVAGLLTYAPDAISGSTVIFAITNENNSPINKTMVTNTFGKNTFTQSGPGSNLNYGGTYTYLKTGSNSAAIYTIKTNPPSVAGEAGTNFLYFTSYLDGNVIHTWPRNGGNPGTDLGAMQIKYSLFRDDMEWLPSVLTDPMGTSYLPESSPHNAKAGIKIVNGSPGVVSTNMSGSSWLHFDNRIVPGSIQYQASLAAIQTNQTLQLSWKMWLQATNSGSGMLRVSVPCLDTSGNQAFYPLLLFMDNGDIASIDVGGRTNAVGRWAQLAGTVLFNDVWLDYPSRTCVYSLNGQRCATILLGPGLTNVVNAFFFTADESSPKAVGNRFALDDIMVNYAPPGIVTAGNQLGLESNQFRFLISAPGNLPVTVIIEANSDLTTANWQPVATNLMMQGSGYYADPTWRNYTGRFYRLIVP